MLSNWPILQQMNEGEFPIGILYFDVVRALDVLSRHLKPYQTFQMIEWVGDAFRSYGDDTM